MTIYTRTGDDGSTGLFFGGRVRKDADAPRAYGAVDEAQAALGAVRAEARSGGELETVLVRLERDLYVVMAELATAPENRGKLRAGTTLVTPEMVTDLEPLIDGLTARFEPPTDFVLPGANRISALLDVARTVVRRAERDTIGLPPEGSSVLAYLNRLSDLVWTMARWQETEHLLAKDVSVDLAQVAEGALEAEAT